MNWLNPIPNFLYYVEVHIEKVREQYDEHLAANHLDAKINIMCVCTLPNVYFLPLKSVTLENI